MNWNMVTLRGAKLPTLLVAGGTLAAYMAVKVGALLPKLGAHADGIFLVGLAASLASMGIFYWRLKRWEHGDWHSCQYCGGPLGWIQMGKVYYGKQLDDYRRCYNCGRATPEGNQ